MKRTLFAACLLITLSLGAHAQNTESATNSKLSIIFDSGLLIGHGEGYYPAPFSSNISFLADINRFLQVGAGTGVEVIGKTFIPLFADIRVIPIKSKPLFIYNRIGGTFCMNKNYSDGDSSDDTYYYRTYPHPLNENVNTSGGFMNELGLGVYLQRSGWKTSLSIGYSFQTTADEIEITPQMTYENKFNRVAFRVGFWF